MSKVNIRTNVTGWLQNQLCRASLVDTTVLRFQGHQDIVEFGTLTVLEGMLFLARPEGIAIVGIHSRGCCA